jgi:histidinol dehydrogenase
VQNETPLRILAWEALDEAGRRAALARPHLGGQAEARRAVGEIIEDVRRGGDRSLRELTRRFDGVAPDELRVSATEFADARGALTPAQVAALERAIANVRAFHRAQSFEGCALEVEPGVHCEQVARPIERVGLYVPAGRAPLPSAVIMLAVPAAIAGCRSRILCTPPARHRSARRARRGLARGAALGPAGADPAVLVAAQLCGIDTVFKVGGAQAIAALAYGTESVPKVDKIFGPGNQWVTAAKQLVAQDPAGAACDLPAGPSEVMVVADASARAAFVAADLLAQAEHDPLSQAILVTTDAGLAAHVAREVMRALPQLGRRTVLGQSLAACRAILVRDLDTALEVSNAYAPEHLILQVENARQWLPAIRNAGAVFLGPWSAEALGDYCTGANHVLPTYGHARACSGLSVRDFLKVITVQEVTRAGLDSLGPACVTLARLEGLEAHALSITRRLEPFAAAPAAARALSEVAP